MEQIAPDSSHRIWCAGLKSWTKLAQKGHWVLGCSDLLGEEDLPGIDTLLGEVYKPLRVTHEDATSGVFEPLPTYKLVKRPLPEGFESKECYYWMSSSSFDYAVEQFPEIKDRWHCCGLGKTAKHIRERLGPGGRVAVFYSYNHWKEHISR
ncbi:MAG: hypothetical protein AAF202_12320 [Pseudomonadota bacterium]